MHKNIPRNDGDEVICLYCKKGKAINLSDFGGMSIKTYIHGNLLITEVYDRMEGIDAFSAMIIAVCPVCKRKVFELEDEEMEEELDEG